MKSSAVNGAANLFAENAKALMANQGTEPDVGFSVYMNQLSMQNQSSKNPDFMSDQSENAVKKPLDLKAEKADLQKPAYSNTESDAKEKNSVQVDKTAAENTAAENRTKAKAENAGTEETAAADEMPRMKQTVGDMQTDLPEETMSQVGVLLADVKQLLMDTFQMTEEELTEALETLGISMMDLLNPETMGECIQLLSGAQDSMELLLDEALYQKCTVLQEEVLGLYEDATTQIQLSPEEMEVVLAKLALGEQSVTEEAQPLESTVEAASEQERVTTDAAPSPVEAGQEMEKEFVQKPVISTTAVQKEEAQEQPVQSVPEEEAAAEEAVPVAKAVSSFMEEKQQESGTSKQDGSQQGLQAFVERPADVAFEPTVQTGFTMSTTDFTSIIRQIAEQIRVQVSADTSSMEMQLNPAHLGRLELQVELRQGLVTARFVAENEQVKEVIENQAIQLQEDLNKQGLKVEAVEVTVETHQFERNLEQGQEQQAEEEAKASENRTRRNLNLDMLDEDEELTEAEDLAAKIMKENGNTLDYLV